MQDHTQSYKWKDILAYILNLRSFCCLLKSREQIEAITRFSLNYTYSPNFQIF